MLIKSKEKKERAFGVKLGLKAERCSSPKCAMIRKPYKPGMHGKRRRGALSEFGQQLLEKQKIKTIYGLKELQLKKIVKEAAKSGAARQNIISMLEQRLANIIFRLGFAPSRIVARQYVSHGHFLVNNKRATIPSYSVRIGDLISIKPSSKNLLIFKDLPVNIKKYEAPGWLEIDKEKIEGRVKSRPIDVPEDLFNINLVVDYYSR